MKLYHLLGLFTSLFMISGCETTIINRGYIIESNDFSVIKVGKDNTKSVFEKFGSPTIRSSLIAKDESYSWYYISKKTEKISFLDPKVLDQKTIVVTFNKDGIVKSVSESKYEKHISTVSETTKSKGKTGGIMGETFGGLGKYYKRYSKKK